MKIKTSNESLYGSEVKLPIDGKVSVSKEGIVEVSDVCADLLLNSGGGNWSKVAAISESGTTNAKKVASSKNQPKKEEEEVEVEVSEAEEIEVEVSQTEEEEEVEDLETLIKKVKSLTAPELVELANQSQYPEEEFSKIKNNKLLMSNYIIKKLKS
jgi:hypothetical protein